eukprot:353764-Chlamydomonas_euryale.AAC.5
MLGPSKAGCAYEPWSLVKEQANNAHKVASNVALAADCTPQHALSRIQQAVLVDGRKHVIVADSAGSRLGQPRSAVDAVDRVTRVGWGGGERLEVHRRLAHDVAKDDGVLAVQGSRHQVPLRREQVEVELVCDTHKAGRVGQRRHNRAAVQLS